MNSDTLKKIKLQWNNFLSLFFFLGTRKKVRFGVT